MNVIEEHSVKIKKPQRPHNPSQQPHSVSPEKHSTAMGIRGRLFLGFFALIVPMLVVMVIFLFKISMIESFTTKLVDVIVPTEGLSITLDTHIYETEIAAYEWLLTGNPIVKSDYTATWNEIMKIQDQMTDLSSKWTNKDYMRRWDTLKGLYTP